MDMKSVGDATDDAQLFPKFISILGRSSSGISKDREREREREREIHACRGRKGRSPPPPPPPPTTTKVSPL